MRSAVKLLLLVAVCLSLTLIFESLSKRWLAHRLTHDFESLSGTAKQTRLIQIAEIGPLAIEPLVNTLADDDLEVARTAYDLLRQAQNEWTVLERSEIEHRHSTMVAALASVAVHLPDDRTGWGTSLLQQTLMTTIDRRDDGSRALYRHATHAMELLSLSERAGPSILSDRPLDPLAPKRLTIKTQPLPVSAFGSARQWTDWPPPQNRSMQSQSPEPATGVIATEPQIVQQHIPTTPGAEEPSVYRSTTARLQPVRTEDPVILRDVNQAHETAYQAAASSASEIHSVTHIVDSPMETFDDQSIMHWLGSPHRALREKAKLELISRGYGTAELAIATQISSGDTKTRIELIDAIARSDSIDPRPWLLMMLEDESRDVKLRVISVLATMNDPNVGERLRIRLAEESDPTVAAPIRRVLDLR